MQHFPLFADLSDRACLVVGGGAVAARKLALLARAGARVTVVAPRLQKDLAARAAGGEFGWRQRRFRDSDARGQRIVIAATNDESVNARVARAARAYGSWVNVVDRPGLSDFISPALIDRAPLLVAVSTGGAMPVLARRVRAWLEALLPASLGPLAAAAARWRLAVRRRLPELSARRRFWDRILDRHADAADPDRIIGRALEAAGRNAGKVYLVGAGPGDPELLTLKALQVLQRADVILHDALVPVAILERARRDARFIDVGKRAGGGHHLKQARINTRLVELARAGNLVCRLKGGDPAFFSRAGEEIEALNAAGIEVEVVPGITAASACAAAAGIPLTHRDLAHRVVLATAHCQDGADCLEAELLARADQTLALYMPVKQLPRLQARLLDRGLPSDTPCALIENASRPGQRALTTTLAALPREARRKQIASPALLIVGQVVRISGADHVYPKETPVASNAA